MISDEGTFYNICFGTVRFAIVFGRVSKCDAVLPDTAEGLMRKAFWVSPYFSQYVKK